MKTAMEDRMPSNSGDTEEKRKTEKRQMERCVRIKKKTKKDRQTKQNKTHKTSDIMRTEILLLRASRSFQGFL